MGNELAWIAAGGIKVNGSVDPDPLRTGATVIADNRLHHLGRHFHSGVGVLIMNAFGNTVAHNEISDLYYTGVSVGWVWGYAPSVSRDNRIEFNYIHHVGHGLLSDLGGFYTLGVSPGTVVRNNVVHDVEGHDKGWGLYTDEGSTGIVLENNLVYRTTHGSFHQHYGRDNIVRNNIFAFGRDAQIVRSSDEHHRSFTFEHNVVYYRTGELLNSVWSGGPNHFTLDHNLYWNTSGAPPQFPAGNFEAWQALGFDKHSRVVDPRVRRRRPRRLSSEARRSRAIARHSGRSTSRRLARASSPPRVANDFEDVSLPPTLSADPSTDPLVQRSPSAAAAAQPARMKSAHASPAHHPAITSVGKCTPIYTRLTPTRRVRKTATPRKYPFNRHCFDRPASIDPSVRYTTAEFKECPLGKLDVITSDLWGTTSGLGRSNCSLSTALKSRPPTVAPSKSASTPYLRQMSKYPPTAKVTKVRPAIPPIAVRSRATSSNHAGPSVRDGSAASRSTQQGVVDPSRNSSFHPNRNQDKAAHTQQNHHLGQQHRHIRAREPPHPAMQHLYHHEQSNSRVIGMPVRSRLRLQISLIIDLQSRVTISLRANRLRPHRAAAADHATSPKT